MMYIQLRHDDVVIQRRCHANGATHVVAQVYAITYPGHTDQGTERDRYEDAERAALELAEARSLSIWYEESPQSGRRILVKSFRDSSADAR